MEALVVDGGRPLSGEVCVGGAKNAALPVLAATMIHGGCYYIENCPNITDVALMGEIITTLGGRVERQAGTLVVDTTGACRWQIPASLMEKMRASVLLLGALLARFGKAEVTMPGGCPLGRRPIDLHLQALAQMGAQITLQGNAIHCRADTLRGGEIHFPFPSVGATENALLASVACGGKVTLRGGAREPEVGDLVTFLRAMGADIAGGDGCWEITGGAPLHEARHIILPDRIETATYLCAAAGCGGRVRLKGTDGRLLLPVLEVLERAGCRVTLMPSGIELWAPLRLCSPGDVATAPYPDFPTDAQAPVMAALLRMEGTARFTEHIFECRFSHVPQMRLLGAKIAEKGTSCVVTGTPKLHGAVVEGTDLRAGAALVVAALQAEGKSMILGLKHVDRGYDRLEEQLQKLQANVFRCTIPTTCNKTTGNF